MPKPKTKCGHTHAHAAIAAACETFATTPSADATGRPRDAGYARAFAEAHATAYPAKAKP